MSGEPRGGLAGEPLPEGACRLGLDRHAATCLLDGRFVVRAVNERFCLRLGFRPQELVGRRVPLLLDERLGQDWPFWRDVLVALRQGQTWRGEVASRHRDGSLCYADTTVVPLGGTGRARRFLVVQSDVTEHRLAEQDLIRTRARLRQLIDCTPAVIYSAVPSGDYVISFISGNVAQMLGYAPVEVVGRQDFWFERVHPEDRPRVFGPLGHLFVEGHHEHEYRIRAKDGRYRWVYDRLHLLRDPHDRPQEIVGVLWDITERKQAERELQEARDAALAASRAKDRFIADMSHDLRTPMNGVLGMLELLRATPLDPRQREYVDLAYRSGRGLLQLFEDILDLSRGTLGTLRLDSRDFDLRALLQGVTELVGARLLAKGLELRLEVAEGVPRWVRGDPTRLRQVLGNLLGNAIKYTDQGRVVLRVAREGACEEEGEGGVRLRFEVEDSGIGIPEAEQGRIFEPFTRVDDPDARRRGGAGLGLAICRQWVELMGGRIGVRSAPGQGSLFWFTAALEPAAARAAPAPAAGAAAPEEGLRGLRVLVVEDNLVNQKVVLGMLERLGCRGAVVGTGGEALEAVVQAPWDLVLLDCQLPDLSGYEVARRLRAWEAEQGRDPLPVVAVTAQAGPGERERCLEAGMDDHLPKPLTLAAVAETLRRWAPACHPSPPSPPEEGRGLSPSLPEGGRVGEGGAAISATPPLPSPPAEGRGSLPSLAAGHGAGPLPSPSLPLGEGGPGRVGAGILADPPLDPAALAGLREALGEAAQGVFDAFAEDAPRRWAAIAEAARRGDPEGLRAAAHTLKGAAGNVGALGLAGLCRELEQRGREARLEGLEALLARAEAELERVLAALPQPLPA
ncbi:MAG: hybrid sensor histidine kinase/response regulator [Gammaproteobacteria bacterium]|nr:MAG: hybrid sensor histidine kinase/response regulator [Gammaproteobacteria bacterium]